ncbi:MAG: sigma 54-interacting transcriptional regulator [bacterium]
MGRPIAGRYEPLGVIGGSGPNEILEVRDRFSGVVLALKRLRDFQDESWAARLAFEFDILSSLSQPAILRVHDFGTADRGRPFFVMDRVNSAPTGAVVDACRDPNVLRDVARRCAHALDHLERRRVVHGDIKPANLLISLSSVKPARALDLRVADFGLARLAGSGSDVPLITGSAGFLAPEKWFGAPASAQSDLYSLGATLWTFATGFPPSSRSPYPASPGEAPLAPWDLAIARPDLPEDLANAISLLLRSEPNDRPATAGAFLSMIDSSHQSASVRSASPTSFVARQAELDAIREVASDANQNGTRVLVFAGERGVGKTRLLNHAASRLALDGARVIRCDAPQFPGILAAIDSNTAASLADATSTHPDLMGKRDRDGMTERDTANASRAEFGDSRRDAGSATDVRRAQRHRRLADRFVSFGGGAPLVLIVDDAHLLDTESVAFMSFLTQRKSVPGVAVIAATDEPAWRALSSHAANASCIATRTLLPLDESETGRFLTEALGSGRLPDGLLSDLLRHTGGNPLGLSLALSQLDTRGAFRLIPSGWTYDRDVIGTLVAPELLDAEIARLDEHTRAVLSDAAIFSYSFEADLLLAFRERDPVDLARALDDACSAYCIVRREGPGGSEFSWSRQTTRAAFLDNLSDADRRSLHFRALEHLEARWRSGVVVAEERLADHAMGCGEPARARAHLRRGASDALARLAFERAHALLGQALRLGEESLSAKVQFARLCAEIGRFDEAITCCDAALDSLSRSGALADAPPRKGTPPTQQLERIDVLRAKGEALGRAGRHAEAVPVLEDAARLAVPKLSGARHRAEILIEFGRALWKSGDYARAVSRLRVALRFIPEASPYKAEALNELAVCCLLRGDLDGAHEYLSRALPIAQGKDPQCEALILAHLSIVERKKGRYARALELRDSSDEIRRRLGLSVLLVNSALERAILLKQLGRAPEALGVVEWAIEENRALGRAQLNGALLLTRGTLLEGQGDWTAAEQAYMNGRELTRSSGDTANEIVSHFLLGELSVKRQDWERAEEEYELGRVLAERIGDARNRLVAQRNSGFLLVERGNAGLAAPVLAEAAEAFAASPYDDWTIEVRARLAFAQLACGRPDDARASILDAERLLKSAPSGVVEAVLARAAAELLLFSGNMEPALAEAKRSVARAREASDTYESACALLLIGDLEERLGRQRRARAAFTEAREIFAACGIARRLDAIDERLSRLASIDAEGAENFEAICRVMGIVASIREPDLLLRTMLDNAIDHVNAERGFVVLYAVDGRDEFEIRAARDISPEFATELARVSRRVLAVAGQDAHGISSERAIDDARFRDAPSVIAHNILSVICAPLRVSGRTLGFVYVDNRRRTRRFSPADVRFLEAFAVQTAFALERANEIRALESALRDSGSQEALIGKSPAMQRVHQLIARAAEVDPIPVHITGENGTGKELVATLIQKGSPRMSRPFIRVNCAAFSESLIESELFGHEKGAFTGARFARAGIFERANGGTLLLDEIGEIPESVQLKLLRVLQELTLTRVGGQKEIHTDARIISATNADLQAKVRAGTFRADLFYRLQGLQIQLPPLRDRLGDIPDLVDHFLRRCERLFRKGTLSITPDALEMLQGYSWPGNVRQLDRELQQALALALARGNLIRRDDFSSTIVAWSGNPAPAGPKKSIREEIDRAERDVLLGALRRCGWVKAEAARHLHCSEGLIRKKIKKYGLRKEA